MKKNQIGSFPPEIVSAIGLAVSKFMREQSLKSEDIRRESGFNASRFAPFKKGGLLFCPPPSSPPSCARYAPNAPSPSIISGTPRSKRFWCEIITLSSLYVIFLIYIFAEPIRI